MDNQHKQISGYRDLNQDEIDGINEIKEAEIKLGALYRQIVQSANPNARWASIAKTHFEEGFSALVRSIARPEARF